MNSELESLYKEHARKMEELEASHNLRIKKLNRLDLISKSVIGLGIVNTLISSIFWAFNPKIGILFGIIGLMLSLGSLIWFIIKSRNI